jgi:hypothetical protein
MTTVQDGGRIVSPTHRPPLPPGNASLREIRKYKMQAKKPERKGSLGDVILREV